jgi:hypothetical protein
LPCSLGFSLSVARVSVALGLGAALVGLAGSAAAQPCSERPPASDPTPDAIAANDLALKMVDEQRYVEALALFQKAYDLSPSYVILFNIGKMAALTGKPARAIRAYECHVVEGGADVTPERRAEVAAEVARLMLEVGQVRIEVDEAGAEVEVDGVVVGKSPLDVAVPLDPGRHRIVVRGSRVAAREVQVEKGASSVVAFELAPAEPVQEAGFQFPGAVVGTAWVATGLLTVSAAITGSLAIIGSSDVDDDVYLGPIRRPPEGSDISDKAERTRALAISTDVLIAIGAITGAAAISFSVVNAVNAGDDRAPKKTAVRVQASPGGVAVVGSFW